jgi:hypothetical protein
VHTKTDGLSSSDTTASIHDVGGRLWHYGIHLNAFQNRR